MERPLRLIPTFRSTYVTFAIGSPSRALGSTTPLWERGDLSTQQILTEDNRNKEISPPPLRLANC